MAKLTSEDTTGRISTRERILLAAKLLFATNGYENTSTMSIARAAHTSESQMIKHFGGKEGLLAAVFEDGWSRIAEAFSAIDYLPTPSVKLQALVGLILSKLEEDEKLKQLLLLEGRRIRKGGRMIIMTQGFLQLVQTVDRLLTEMQEIGQLLPDMNVEGVRSALIGMMEGLLRDRMLAGRMGYSASYGPDDIRRLFLHVLHSFSAAPRIVPASRAQG